MVAEKNSSSGKVLSALVDDLQAGGRYTFDRSEAISALRRYWGQMLYRMSSHLLGGSAERFTALVDGMRKK
jgi:hypothetical protein